MRKYSRNIIAPLLKERYSKNFLLKASDICLLRAER